MTGFGGISFLHTTLSVCRKAMLPCMSFYFTWKILHSINCFEKKLYYASKFLIMRVYVVKIMIESVKIIINKTYWKSFYL